MDDDEATYLPTEDIIEEYDLEDAVRPSSHPPQSDDDDDEGMEEEKSDAENGQDMEQDESEAQLAEYEAVQHDGVAPQAVFTGHYPHEVYAVTSLPNNMFVSGGGDDRLFFVAVTADKGLLVVHEEEREESVSCIAGNKGNNLVASGWVDGVIRVHLVSCGGAIASGDQSPRVELVGELEGITGEVMWLEWRDGETLAAGGEDGSVWLWSVSCEPNGSHVQHIFSGNGHKSMCGAFTSDTNSLVTGDDNGLVCIYSVTDRTLTRKLAIPHGDTATTIATHPTLKLFLVGCLSGAVYLCQMSAPSVPTIIRLGQQASIESIILPTPSIFIVGSMDGTLNIVDCQSHSVRHKICFEDGICSMAMLSDQSTVVVGCSDGQIKTVNVRNGDTTSAYSSNGAPILDIQPYHGGGFVVGSAGGSVSLYPLPAI